MSTLIVMRRDELKDLDMSRVDSALVKLTGGGALQGLAGDIHSMFEWSSDTVLGRCCADVAGRGLLANKESLYLVYRVLYGLSNGAPAITHYVGNRDFRSYTYPKKRIYIGKCDVSDIDVAYSAIGRLVYHLPHSVLGERLAYKCCNNNVRDSLRADWEKLDDIDHYNLRAFLNAVVNGKREYALIERPATENTTHVSVLWKF